MTLFRLVATWKPRSHAKFLWVTGRMFSVHSVPEFRIWPTFAASLRKPLLAAVGTVRITSLEFRRYQVKLKSATSLNRPRSIPASNSLVRSGRSSPGLGGVAEEAAEPVLRCREGATPEVLVEAAAQVGERGQIRLGLGADLAVGRAQLAVGERAAFAGGLGELPGGAGAGEPRVLGIDPEARRPVVADAALEEDLVPQVKGSLREITCDPELGLVVDRWKLARRVGQGIRFAAQGAHCRPRPVAERCGCSDSVRG